MRIIQVILCAILFQVSYQRHICKRIEEHQDISIKDFPFVVSIYVWPVECTGIVISTRHILTAKRCLDNEYEHRLIVLGSNYRKPSGKYLLIFNKSQEYLHPDEDLGIIYFCYGLNFSDSVNAISLPTWSDAHLNVTGKEAFITGFKNKIEKEETSCDLALQAVNITISLMESKKIISVDEKSTNISAGAPLLINQTLWGVASANDGKTQIYTSVPQQLKWITLTTGIKFKN